MRWDRAPSVSWSVRHRGGPPPHAPDLADGLRHLLAARFPESSGYEIEAARLTGPIDGSVFRVTRGDFCARVSLQMYRRGRKTSSETHELRLFGSASSGRIERARRASSRWDVAGRALGLGLGALTFAGSAAVMAALFGHSLLAPGSPLWVASVVPAGLLAWMSGAVARAALARRGRLTLRAASCDAGEDERLAAALEAWSGAVPELSGQQELAQGHALAQPFRTRALAPAQ